MISIKGLLSPPVFLGDEEKTRRAGLLNFITLTVLAFAILIILGNFWGGKTPASTLVIDFLMIISLLQFYYWLKGGKIVIVGIGLTIIGFIFITAVCLSLGTIRTPSTALYLFWVIFVGELFDLKGIVFSAIASSLAVAGMIAAENSGLLPPPDYSVTITQWITYTAVFGVTAGLSFYLNRTARHALAQAQKEIKKREKIEMELRKLALTVEQSPSSIVITDLNGSIEYVNPRFTQVTGYNLDEVIGKNSHILSTDLTPPETYLDLWKTITSGKEWRGEFTNRKKDGSLYYESARISPITDLNGVATHYLAVKEDITRSKQAEEALRENNELFSMFLEHSPILTYILEVSPAQSRVVKASKNFRGMLGTSNYDVIGKSMEELFPPELAAKFTAEDWDVLSTGKVLKLDEVINDHIYTTIKFPIRQDGKDLVAGYTIDITERKRAEEALRASESRFRSLFEQTHDAIFILDFNGCHITANQRAADMLGYTLDEIRNLSVKDTSAESNESQNILSRLMDGAHVPIYERLFRKKNGQTFSVEINVELVRDINGKPLHIQSVVRDISQRKHDEMILKATSEQLKLRLIEIEQLHEELRQQALHDPLTGLYNRRYLSESMVREQVRAEREKSCVSIIATDIDHFKMINDTYGHQIGDIFLVEIGRMLQQYARSSDIIFRYGGEEFLLVLPGATLVTAELRAEMIRKKCIEIIVQHEGKDISVTMSFGVATFPVHGIGLEEVIIKSDKALYDSKHSGRNKVTIWTQT